MIKQKSNKDNVFFILFLLLLVVFEFFSMQTQLYRSVNYYAQTVYLIYFVISLTLVFKIGQVKANFFLKLFVFWMFYNSLRFITSTTGHNSLSSFFNYTWFCNCYIITYVLGWRADNREKILMIFFGVLMSIAFYFTYQNRLLYSYGSFDFEDSASPSNVIFWSLCLVPVVFLFKNKTIQILFISIETVLVMVTMKRSAVISMALLLVLFIITIFSKNNNESRLSRSISKTWTILIAVIIFSVFSPKLSGLYENNKQRFERIEEDGGSNRVNVWNDTFKGLSNSNIMVIVFGHGVASSQEIIGHTSAHNDFLTLLLEFGIIGGLMYLLFIIKVIKRVLYTRKQDRQLFYCYTSILILLLVVGNVGDLFTCYTYLGFIMVFLAVLELRLDQRNYNSGQFLETLDYQS